MRFTFLFIFLILIHTTSQACIVRGLTLSELQDHDSFVLLERSPSAFKAQLFAEFSSRLGSFNPEECREALEKAVFKHRQTGKIITTLRTTQDECDGGNSYGLIFVGTIPRPEKVIATIEDSMMNCLP